MKGFNANRGDPNMYFNVYVVVFFLVFLVMATVALIRWVCNIPKQMLVEEVTCLGLAITGTKVQHSQTQ
jgi:hypothetical protein